MKGLKAFGATLLALLPALATSTLVARFAPLTEADALLAATVLFPLAWLAWVSPLLVAKTMWRPAVIAIGFTGAATLTVYQGVVQ